MPSVCADCGRTVDPDALDGLCAACLLADMVAVTQDTLPVELPVEPHGRYRELHEHARGGMGRILLAHDAHLDRSIALKELLPHEEGEGLASARARSARFLQEARVLGRLEHPSIVPVHEIGRRPDGSPYYTMRFIAGRSLEEALREASTLQARLALLPHFVDLCQAIAYAHSQGVLHRDIKPANVMVGSFGETAVVDWGLAKFKTQERTVEAAAIADGWEASCDALETRYGTALGTPAYMSPEQAQGALDKLDERSDVYALGAVLYEYLTGRPPYTADSPQAVIQRVLTVPPTPVCELSPDASRPLVTVCERAMQRDKDRRYPTVQALLDDINRFMSGALVQAHEYSFRELTMHFFRRHRVPLLLAAAALTTLSAIGIYAYLNVLDARAAEQTQRLLAEQEHYRLDIRAARAEIETRDFQTAQRVLLACPPQYRNWEWGYLTRLCLLDRWTAANSNAPLTSIAVTSAGDLVAAGGTDGVCRVWRMQDARELYAKNLGEGEIRRLRLSPDGKRLLTVSERLGATLCDALDGGNVITLKASVALNDADFVAEGAVVVAGAEDGSMCFWDATTGQPTRTVRMHGDAIVKVTGSPDGRYALAGVRSGGVSLWDVAHETEVKLTPGHSEAVSSLCFGHNGQLAASTSLDGTACIWSLPEGALLFKLTEHRGSVLSGEFSSDDTRFLTASADRTAIVWEVASGKLVTRLGGRSNAPLACARFSSDGLRIVTGGDDGTISVWNATSGLWLTNLSGAPWPVTDVLVTPQSREVIAASGRWLMVWGITFGSARAALESVPAAFVPLAFSPDRLEIAVFTQFGLEDPRRLQKGLSQGTFWDADSYKAKSPLPPLDDTVIAADYVQNRLRVITHDGRVWDAQGKPLFALSGREMNVSEAVFSIDGRYLVTLHDGKPNACVWNAGSGELLRILQTDNSTAVRVALADDNSLVAVGMGLGPVYVFDPGTGKEVARFHIDNNGVCSLGFSHAGDRLACGTGLGDSFIWDIQTGKLVTTLAHGATVYAIAFSPDDSRIATAAFLDRAVYVWDARSGTEFLKLTGPEAQIVNCAWSPDGRKLLAAYNSGQAIVWDTAPWKEHEVPGPSNVSWRDRYVSLVRDADLSKAQESYE